MLPSYDVLNRYLLSYGLFDDQDWFELHVLLLVLSYGALRVARGSHHRVSCMLIGLCIGGQG